MKKLLFIEILVAVLFLGFLVVSVGMLTSSIHSMNTNSSHLQTNGPTGDRLRLNMGDLQGDFSPLVYQGEAQENLLSLCFDNLLSRDEAGRVEETGERPWKKDEMTFAHIACRKGQQGAYITINVNPDIRTPDGKKITVRDIIFNFYLRLDASSGLSDIFAGTEIEGAKAFSYGSNDIAARDREIASLLSAPSEELKKKIQEEIIIPELQREYLWVQGLYQDDKYQFITSKYTKPKDLFAYYYAYQTTYQSGSRTENQVMEDIVAQYGANYIALGKVTERDYSGQVKRMALGEILRQDGKDTVSSISGIRQLDDHTVEIHVISGENIVEKICDFWVLPIAVYGSEKLYDGEKCFGYQKGQAEKIVSLAQEKFRGTGPYYMSRNNQSRIYLKKNPCYRKKVMTGRVDVNRNNYEQPEKLVNQLLLGKLDMAVAKEDEKLEKLLKNQATGAAYLIKKVKMESDNLEECILYRTDCVNATTFPAKKQTIRGVFHEFYKVKLNPPLSAISPSTALCCGEISYKVKNRGGYSSPVRDRQ